MKRRIFIFIFLLMIAAFPARADYFFGPGSTGTGSMTYPGIGIPYTADGASWGASFGVGRPQGAAYDIGAYEYGAGGGSTGSSLSGGRGAGARW